MIVEFNHGKLKMDPHKIGPNNANQGGGSAAGFDKFWWNWNGIRMMQKIAAWYYATH